MSKFFIETVIAILTVVGILTLVIVFTYTGDLLAACEKDLPPGQHCELIAVPVKEDE